MKRNKWLVLLSGIALGAGGTLLVLFRMMPPIQDGAPIDPIVVERSLANLPVQDYNLAAFPEHEFVSLIRLTQNPAQIEEFYTAFLKLGQDPNATLELLSKCYTTSLETQWKMRLDNIDSAALIMEWAEGLKGYPAKDENAALIYDVAAGYWFEKIAKTLEAKAQAEPDIKFSFRYRYLAERCHFHQYNVNVPITKVEKVFIRLADARIGYILSRVKLDAPYLLWAATLAGVFTLIGIGTSALWLARRTTSARSKRAKSEASV